MNLADKPEFHAIMYIIFLTTMILSIFMKSVTGFIISMILAILALILMTSTYDKKLMEQTRDEQND